LVRSVHSSTTYELWARVTTALVLLFAATAWPAGQAPQPISSLTTDQIEEAIRIGSDEKAARTFLNRYLVQMHAGWGDGPRMGVFTTPFARIVQAAATARKNGGTFSKSDVTAEDLVPELHVIVTFQPSAVSDAKEVPINSITITRGGSVNGTDAIEPLKSPALQPAYQSRYGLVLDGAGIVASFPLSAVAPDREIRVSFREVVKGTSAASNCQHCVVPFPLTGIR